MITSGYKILNFTISNEIQRGPLAVFVLDLRRLRSRTVVKSCWSMSRVRWCTNRSVVNVSKHACRHWRSWNNTLEFPNFLFFYYLRSFAQYWVLRSFPWCLEESSVSVAGPNLLRHSRLPFFIFIFGISVSLFLVKALIFSSQIFRSISPCDDIKW